MERYLSYKDYYNITCDFVIILYNVYKLRINIYIL